jgi:hypothetical protein
VGAPESIGQTSGLINPAKGPGLEVPPAGYKRTPSFRSVLLTTAILFSAEHTKSLKQTMNPSVLAVREENRGSFQTDRPL